MTKKDLIDEVARVAEMPRKEAEEVIDQTFASIARALSRGEKVEIRNFGNFRRRERPGRVARNPKTGLQVEVPARTIGVFRAGKELRELVDGPQAEPPVDKS